METAQEHTFGISSPDAMLLAMLAAVQKLLLGSGAQIEDIKHNQYQEAYFFQRDSESARINIAYKANGKIAALSAPVRSGFAVELLKLLEPLLIDSVPSLHDEQQTSEDTPNHTFDISQSDTVLLAILAAVQKCLDGGGTHIQDIKHNQYQEAYFFQRDNESTRINIAYNSKGKIAALSAPVRSGFAVELLKLLGPLIGVKLSVSDEICIDPAEPFLSEFYARVRALSDEKGITVRTVKALYYGQRYTFIREGEEVTFDIWYNGKHQFKKAQPSQDSFRFPNLMTDVSTILTDGLSE